MLDEGPDARWDDTAEGAAAARPQTLRIGLEIEDPELVAELLRHDEGPAREGFALTALRIGILALKQAQGRLDADVLRGEGDRVMAELERRLDEHRQAVTLQVASSLKEYFDPDSGRFSERVERLVRKDGELEQVLQRQIGVEDSALAKTLAAHFGAASPLMDLLSPDASKGVVQALGQTIEQALKDQRERVLREFSLDNRDSALSRLVHELAERHGKLTENLQGSIKEVVGEFSLDQEDSALSRLVRRVEQTQRQISSEFSLDAESSALARMKRELLEVLAEHQKASTRFQQEVMAALSAMQARKDEARRSTAHGDEFEAAVYRFLQSECQRAGDIAAATGQTTGLIKNCKVGDAVIELGPESAARGARIVVEAKESAAYQLSRARQEMETARKNRGAGVGLFVFSARTAPEGLQPLARYGQDVFAVWDAEQPDSDVFLWAGLSVARALCTRAAAERESLAVDLEPMERAIRDIEKQAQGLEEITRLSGTIRSNSDKILDRARIMQKALGDRLRLLDEGLDDLKTVLQRGEPR